MCIAGDKIALRSSLTAATNVRDPHYNRSRSAKFEIAVNARPCSLTRLRTRLHVRIAVMKALAVELIPDPELGGYTARMPDIPAYGGGETEEAALADLKDALGAYVEAFRLDEATTRSNSPSSLRQLNLQLEDLVRA